MRDDARRNPAVAAVAANRLCGLHFRRQQVLDGFIVDFYCHRAALVIEVDGPIHDERKDYDHARDELMTTRGLHVLRFTNNQIETEIVKVLSVIRQVAAKRVPGLPPYELPPDEYLQAKLPRPPSAHRATGTPFLSGRGVGGWAGPKAMSTPEHFDAVIVGSGFGGSVMACRLAEAGLSVCLLERGKAYPPGSFPRSPHAVKDNFWDPSEGQHGLFNIWSFRHLEAVISAGLGGGSLIYANVLIRKDEKWFVRDGYENGAYEYWPVTREDLDPHYERVEKMLGGQVYPFDKPPYDATSKTRAMQIAAERLGIPVTTFDRVDPTRRQWYLPLLAVSFANEGREPLPGQHLVEQERNLHDRDRQTCRLCGECDVGCNYGAKNTLDYNYLTRAKHLGADIRTLAEVKRFAPLSSSGNDGYQIEYVEHTPLPPGARPNAKGSPSVPPPQPKTITAKRLILSAGTLGSTYLLLKNGDVLPGLSPTLGSRFCGNGDFLSFAFRCGDTDDAGVRTPRLIDPSHGPVITSTFRLPDHRDGVPGGRGFYLQDAGYPAFLNWVVEAADAGGQAKRIGGFFLRRARALVHGDPQSDISGEMDRLLGDCELSAARCPCSAWAATCPTAR
jgi:cholesterol oxidase